MKRKMLVIGAAVMALVAFRASATPYGAGLLDITEVTDTVLTATFNNAPVTVIYNNVPDTWTIPNVDFGVYGPAAWQEPDYPIDQQWNLLVLQPGGITIQSDVSDRYVQSVITDSSYQLFYNNANHVLGVADSLAGSAFDPSAINITFHDDAGSSPNDAPDGGLTAGLLGGALIGLGALRRKLSV
jgi:hypothetical protein